MQGEHGGLWGLQTCVDIEDVDYFDSGSTSTVGMQSDALLATDFPERTAGGLEIKKVSAVNKFQLVVFAGRPSQRTRRIPVRAVKH